MLIVDMFKLCLLCSSAKNRVCGCMGCLRAGRDTCIEMKVVICQGVVSGSIAPGHKQKLNDSEEKDALMLPPHRQPLDSNF